MAPPPNLKRLAAENFEGAEDWFLEAFLPQLNGFLGDVVNALSGALTHKENLLSEERDIQVMMGVGSGSPDAAPFPLYIKPQKVLRPRNVIVTFVKVETSVTASPVSAVMPFWDLTSKGLIRIRWFTGLDASTTYSIRVRFD